MVDEDRCNKCGNLLIIGDNWTEGRKNSSTYLCKECHNNINMMNRVKRKDTFMGRLRDKISAAMTSHRKKGIEVIGSIDEYVHTYTGECAYCGMEFDIFSDNIRNVGSIDRIDNELYMTPDNIQWLCHRCNTTKGDRSHDEFMAYIEMIYNRQRRR